MSVVEDRRPTKSAPRKRQKVKVSGKILFRARPCESIDYKALAADVRARFPRILARLAE